MSTNPRINVLVNGCLWLRRVVDVNHERTCTCGHGVVMRLVVDQRILFEDDRRLSDVSVVVDGDEVYVGHLRDHVNLDRSAISLDFHSGRSVNTKASSVDQGNSTLSEAPPHQGTATGVASRPESSSSGLWARRGRRTWTPSGETSTFAFVSRKRRKICRALA